jgi:curli biogenesis system outer membrane secretion channel CsgG
MTIKTGMHFGFGLAVSIFLLLGCAHRVLVPPQINIEQIQRVAVLAFETDSFFSTIGQQVADEMVVELLEKAKGIEVIERSRIDALMQEQQLARGGYISSETAVKLGSLLGVQMIVTGSVSVAIGDIQSTPSNARRVASGAATLRCIDAQTGKVLLAKREKAEYADYFERDESGNRTYINRTDHELAQEVIHRLAKSLAKYFYAHEELRY